MIDLMDYIPFHFFESLLIQKLVDWRLFVNIHRKLISLLKKSVLGGDLSSNM
jgi:hypothetical protein